MDVHHGVLVDLFDEISVDIVELFVQSIDLGVETGEGGLVGESLVEVGDWVEVGRLERRALH